MIGQGRTPRRTILRAGLAVLATGAAGGVAAQDADKLAQSVVQYQTMPKDGAKCSGCVNYVEPKACKIVAGVIAPDGWCVAYAPKDS